MFSFGKCFLLLFCFALVLVRASIAPIWISPTNYSTDVPEHTATKGEWTSIDIGAGSRGLKPVVHVDSKGTIWIMGSYGTVYYRNAVWNYDPKTDLYRWVAGRVDSPTENHLVLGEFGVQDPDAYMGGPIYSGSAIDHNDNIWIYGNTDYPRNHFWMFNTTSFQFTFLGLDPLVPVVGELGKPASDNYPGNLEGSSILVDSQNNLWLVGGWRSDYSRNHVWHFNTTSLQWTWMWGDPSGSDPTDFASNTWGGRWFPAATIDEEDRIWIFGGYGIQPNGSIYNEQLTWGDMWSFDTKTLEWRVEWGNDSSFMTDGSVAVPDAFDIGNYPRARDGPFMVDRQDGTLLVGGGYVGFLGLRLNDYWLFNKTSKLWKLVYGDVEGDVANEWTNYQTEGGVLGAREYNGGAGDIHSRGNLVIFGGDSSNQGTSFLSDIWIFPQDQCLPSVSGCDVNAACTPDHYFSSICTCNEGYEGDGKTCTIIVPSSPSSSESPTTTPTSKTSGSTKISASIFACLFIAVLA